MTGEANTKKCRDMVLARQNMWEYLKENMIHTENVDFTVRFVFAGFIDVINYLGKAAEVAVREEQIKKIVFAFFEIWMPVTGEERSLFDRTTAFVIVLHEIEKWDEEERAVLINRFWDSKEQYWRIRRDLDLRLRMEMTDRLKALPFYKEGCRVGVYGIGRHTEAFLNLYRNLIGEIRCDLYFIVTEKTADTYADRPVLSVAECKGFVDAVIISSRIYQEEMKENLIREGMDERYVILLYQQGDICDFITVNEILTAV